MKYILLILFAFNHFFGDESRKKPSVLVLPTYDEIANAGISPNIQQFLENDLIKSEKITLIKFSLQKFKDVPYLLIFDKKYCKAIFEKEKTDIIVMSKIVYKKRTGNMMSDLWDFQLLIYNTKLDKQKYSEIKAKNLTSNEIQKYISNHVSKLIDEIVR